MLSQIWETDPAAFADVVVSGSAIPCCMLHVAPATTRFMLHVRISAACAHIC